MGIFSFPLGWEGWGKAVVLGARMDIVKGLK